jgi:hypothetical protein
MPVEDQHIGSGYDDILRQSFESLAARLDHGNRHKSRFALIDVSHNAYLAGMGAAEDFASCSVF